MKYYVTLDGEEYALELASRGDAISFGDASWPLDLVEIEPGARYSVRLGARSYDVVVEERGGQLHLQVSGHGFQARVEDERQRSARCIAASAPKGPVTVVSVMPGILRDVRVQPGDRVEAGQALVILEAMKMENEIDAEQAGVVREVLVQTGQAVEGGQPLVVLDPPPDEEAAAGS